MKIFVKNCFHWVGYHILDYFLMHDYELYGYHEQLSEKERFIADFFGRNSNFKQVDSEKNSYDLSFYIENVPLKEGHKQPFIALFPSKRKMNLYTVEEQIYDLPIIFGEWMKMDQKGVFLGENYLSFDDEQFMKEGMYIRDFLEYLVHHSSLFLTDSERKLNPPQKKDRIFDKIVDFSKNINNEEKVKKILSHYKRFHTIYYSMIE